MGIQNNLKIRDTYIINMMLSGNFYGSQIRHWSLGVKFWHRDFFSILFEALGIFLGFDFCPHYCPGYFSAKKVPSRPRFERF